MIFEKASIAYELIRARVASGGRGWKGYGMIDIYSLHERMTKHLFPSYASEDERFLALALCGEAGELANMIKKRWRDGADLTEEIRDELADIRVYLELLARCFDIEGAKLDEQVQKKLAKVVEKHKERLT
jgi:NTP pyrophosphatase (non-canonical NTP hydrolase)